MKKITKTITMKVPVECVFNYLKESPRKLERYCEDLYGTGTDIIKTSEYSITNEVTNREIEFASNNSGTGINLKYSIDKLSDGSSSEITINMECGWGSGFAARSCMISVIGALLALERGYRVGLRSKTLSSEKHSTKEEKGFLEETQEKAENEETISQDLCMISLCESRFDDSDHKDSVIDLVAAELRGDIDSLVKMGIEMDKGELATKTGGMAWAGYEAFTGDWLSALVVGGISLLAGSLTSGYKKIKVMEMQQKWKDRLCGLNNEQLMYLAEGLERKYPLLMRRFQSLLEAGQ